MSTPTIKLSASNVKAITEDVAKCLESELSQKTATYSTFGPYIPAFAVNIVYPPDLSVTAIILVDLSARTDLGISDGLAALRYVLNNQTIPYVEMESQSGQPVRLLRRWPDQS